MLEHYQPSIPQFTRKQGHRTQFFFSQSNKQNSNSNTSTHNITHTTKSEVQSPNFLTNQTNKAANKKKIKIKLQFRKNNNREREGEK